ncbi:IclR family transcriptional regulator domain-containing protein [Actinopolymorpha pittospori]|uniref:IclR family acetate operon transcriptional repressor n=1 Tax=Actinopolymorpha pittospori TaxID=648752 RepID=A0A927R8W7_9ACTN|nr:IclR family acetate operon transcriptional repressor [Actinopolymorpha pittospori]
MRQRRPREAERAGGDVDRYMVRSVVRAIGVLEVLADRGTSDGLSVTEIAQECGLSKSIVFSVLHTLRAHGLVADHGEGQSRRYRLGLGLSRLGDRAREQLSLLDLARPVLRELAARTGLSARLAVFQYDAAISVDRVDVPAHVHIDLRMGAREMLHSTGIGKAMLASLPDAEVERIIAFAGLPRRTPHTITDRDNLLAEIKEIRRVGYALDDEEDAEGIFCVGSGVRDDAGACVAAISVTGLKTAGAADRYDEIGGALRSAARRISEQLGYTGNTGAEGGE